MKKVLVACEESQAVTIEMRKLGIEAWSCDLLPCSGGKPEWHLQLDVKTILHYNWAMVIAFPPCTHLASSGARWFEKKRLDGRQQEAIDFFMLFTKLSCPLVVIENPIGIMSTVYRKPDQIIQPFWFGHRERKSTCLWLKGLPLLKGTDVVSLSGNPKKDMPLYYLAPGKERSKLRSKTYIGIAKALAIQYGRLL